MKWQEGLIWLGFGVLIVAAAAVGVLDKHQAGEALVPLVTFVIGRVIPTKAQPNGLGDGGQP